jgi:hypothetical protein
MSEFDDVPSTPTSIDRTAMKLRLQSSEKMPPTALDASKDARDIIRLVQCTQCSYPLREPMTLPCGNSLCKACLPTTHVRRNISYPATANRLQGFTCPFSDCGKEHAVGDCSLDVTLTKLMEVIGQEISQYRPLTSDTPILLEEKNKWQIAGLPSLSETGPRSRVLHGGRLVATYTMAEMGELDYQSEVSYTAMSEKDDEYYYLDLAVLQHMKEATRTELDCQVCYALMLDPLTTSCGHTYCRTCLHRVMDHSKLCPICRRELSLPPVITQAHAPSNKRLCALIAGLVPDLMAARAEAAAAEEASMLGELDTPLFVCTLSFPMMPTFLHIFEPRYRLMIRRAIESGSRKFGMLLNNPRQEDQDELGRVPFYQYGTLLHIVNMELLPDGRSMIETVGVSRFRVKEHGMLDGYLVGRIERIDDIPLAAEEALEAAETSRVTPTDLSAPNSIPTTPQPAPSTNPGARWDDLLANIDSKSTKDLMAISTLFIAKMRANSAPWLHTSVFHAYGECPDDPAIFPWWFASLLPIVEQEKYKLLAMTSVRERLKLCARWVEGIDLRYRR